MSNRWCVIKIGGELASDVERLARSVGTSIRRLQQANVKVLMVHGGGPQATALSRALALTPTLVKGQRVTDEATLEVMKMALAGQASVDVARALRKAQITALCTSGVSGSLLTAARRPPVVDTATGESVDYGWVGDVKSVNVSLLESLFSCGVVPVVASLAGDDSGNIYNVNADTVACGLAKALNAAVLFLVSNVAGVLRDKADPTSRIAHLPAPEARRLIAKGVIFGGMIPKIEEAISALEASVAQVHILGLDPPDAILRALEVPGAHGTRMTPE